MNSILEWFEPLHIKSWYVLVALLLAFGVQIAKKSPVAARIWSLPPKNWRWIWTALAGFCTGFVSAYSLGLPVQGALLAGVGGLFGIGTLSGGINDWMEKSVLPWPGSPKAGSSSPKLGGG